MNEQVEERVNEETGNKEVRYPGTTLWVEVSNE